MNLRPFVAKHHWPLALVQHHKRTTDKWTTPITREQAESGFLYSLEDPDNALKFTGKSDEVGSAFLRGKASRKSSIRPTLYVQGTTVPADAVDAYVNSLTSQELWLELKERKKGVFLTIATLT